MQTTTQIANVRKIGQNFFFVKSVKFSWDDIKLNDFSTRACMHIKMNQKGYRV